MNLTVLNAADLDHRTREAFEGILPPLNQIGEWITVPFDATRFTANGAMTWTVAETDVVTFAYTLVGSTMTLTFFILTSTVAGTLNTNLMIKIPGGYRTRLAMGGAYFCTDNGTSGAGFWQVSEIDMRHILLYTPSLGNWSASTNATNAVGTVSFEVVT